jgi:opacity protein-like surface antigen
MSVITHRSIVLSTAALITILTSAASAQEARQPAPDASRSQPAIQPDAAAGGGDDAELVLAEPDFRVLNLPSTLRLPRHGSSFELTHRFNGNLRQGSFSDNAGNLFGLDQGAVVGFEYRFGIARHLQAVVYRTAIDKTVQFSGKYDAVRQGGSIPVSVSALASVEGTDNFQERYSPALGAAVSRTVADRLALYATPVWSHNTAALLNVDRDTFFVGVGGRVRVSATVYLVGEVAPRAGGYRPDKPAYGFAIEKRAGGHLFQLNFNNGQGTTFAQLARGGFPDSLYLGFNLARKFF